MPQGKGGLVHEDQRGRFGPRRERRLERVQPRVAQHPMRRPRRDGVETDQPQRPQVVNEIHEGAGAGAVGKGPAEPFAPVVGSPARDRVM